MILASVILKCDGCTESQIAEAVESFRDQDWPHKEMVLFGPREVLGPQARTGWRTENGLQPGHGHKTVIGSNIAEAVAKTTGEYCFVWKPGFAYKPDAIRVHAAASNYREVVVLCQGDEQIAYSFARRNVLKIETDQLGRRYIDSGHSGFRNKPWSPPELTVPTLDGFGKEGALNLLCPAGIGDILWILSKFGKLAKERDIVFWLPAGEQNRAGGLCRMAGLQYGYLPTLTTSWVWGQPGSPALPKEGWAAVQANRHLESGNILERWYPDLPLAYPKLAISYFQKQPEYVVGFMCLATYMGGQLTPEDWGNIFQYIQDHVAPVQIVGAGGDVDFAKKVSKFYRSPLAPLYDRPLEEVISVVLKARAVVGVASGLLITSIAYGVPSVIAYPKHLDKMPGTWEPFNSLWSHCFTENLPQFIANGALQRLLK